MPDAGQQDFVAGVDFGGTKIRAGILNERFECAGRARVSTKAHRGKTGGIERIARCVTVAGITGGAVLARRNLK